MTPNLCPDCGDPYEERLRGSKITIPEGFEACKHQREYEGDAHTGIWYLHEVRR